MARQRFNGKTLYTKTCSDNILRIYDTKMGIMDTQIDWYWEAHYFAIGLSETFKVSIIKVCGIIAALSPMKKWSENKRIVETFLRNGNAYHTKVFKDKAKDILKSKGDIAEICDILSGNKITSFFLNILEPNNSDIVTIDRHAQDVAFGDVIAEYKRSMTDNQYNFFVNCYRVASQKRGITPSKMQAVTWVKWRKLKENMDIENVPF